jgi:hypothetical protein
MERSSNKHGRLLDEELKHETAGLTHAGRSTRAEEWRDPEPSGEDQPEVDARPDGAMIGAVPDGMTPEDVEDRATLASHLGKEVYPARRDELIDKLVELNAPARLVSRVRDLPPDREFQNVQEVAVALGLGVEQHRF